MATGLVAERVSVHFSGVHAIEDVSLSLGEDEILGLVGPNGAGKTTMVNVLSGFQRPNAGGSVRLDGALAAGWSPDRFARAGAVRTFQAVRLFKGLTVSQNVEAAFAAAGRARSVARREARRLLEYLGIADRADAAGDALSYGDERRVGIARALALSPRYLMLDEPAAGMNLGEAEALGALIRRIRHDFGCGILLIEHNMTLVMKVCQRLHVLSGGRTIATGAPEEVMANPEFRTAYLGASHP